MSLNGIADQYFGNLNSTAARIYSDIQEVKSSYEGLWKTLSEKEQQIIISESIIKPEISLKYKSKEEIPKQDYAVKLIYDDHCSYRDEHSGPFSFKSKSQRDLTIFQTDKPKPAKTKPKAPSKPPITFSQKPAVSRGSIEQDSSSILPKTGLDFLDNW